MSSIKIDRKLVFGHRGVSGTRLRNTSGGTVNAGAVVIYDTASTDGFTTTTSQDNVLVAGMCTQTVSNGEYAFIQQTGFTDLLKVNGTTDIAVGDAISAFTSAGIGAKATAGLGGAFAIALEAYQTNDSNGVIDAWLHFPGRVNSSGATYGLVGAMAANGTGTANTVGTGDAARVDHIHKIGTHDHSDNTKGDAIVLAALGSNFFSADANGRAKFAAGLLDVTTFQSVVAAGILSADATGRALVAANFFNAATLQAKIPANAFDATTCTQVFADNAIGAGKVNWSFGTPTNITPDDTATIGAAVGPANASHIHGITAAAPSAGLAAADAEGAATSFARSNHVHKATVTDAVDFTYGASDDAGLRWSTSDADNHALVMFLGASKAVHITDAVATDWNVAAYSHPTLGVHSNTTPATDYMRLYHDATYGYLDVFGGDLVLAVAGTQEVLLTATVLSPYTTGGSALGSGTLMWNGLYLAASTPISWNNGNVTITHAAGKITVAAGTLNMATNLVFDAALDIVIPANTAAALEVSDGTAKYLAIDTRTATDGMNAFVFDVADPTFASAAGSVFRMALWSGYTLNLTGGVGVSALDGMGISFQAASIAAAGATTVTIGSTIYIVAPTEGANVTLATAAAISIDNCGGTPTTQVGLRIANLTSGATNDYGIHIVGADTYAIFVDAGLVRFDGSLEFNTTNSNINIGAVNVINFDTGAAVNVRVRFGDKAGAAAAADFVYDPAAGAGFEGFVYDTTNGRLAWFGNGGVHYVTQTAGFVIPDWERLCPICGVEIKVGDAVAGVIDAYQSDEARHGLYTHLDCLGGQTRGITLPKKSLQEAMRPKPALVPA